MENIQMTPEMEEELSNGKGDETNEQIKFSNN